MFMRPHALASAAPRALCGPVRAETDPAVLLRQINVAFTEFKSKNDRVISNIDAALSQHDARFAAIGLTGDGGGGGLPPDPEYSTTFATWFRSGEGEQDLKGLNANGQRGLIKAAMSVGSAGDGGYLAPTEWDRKVRQAQLSKSPMRRLSNVQTTTVGAYSTLWTDQVIGSGWVGETAARPETSTPGLLPLTFKHGEIYANPAITQRLLDDAEFKIEDWLAEHVESEFNIQEGIAFLSGNGTNKPFGLLTYVTGGAAAAEHPGGVISTSTVAGAAAITADELITVFYALTAPYRPNATWLMNSATAAYIAKLKDGDGNYLWRESFLVGQPATLLGRPVEFDENMPSMAAGLLPIVFGDFKAGYLINDRGGIRILRDPYTNKPYVHFYTTKRVGAGVADPKAFRIVKMAAS